MYFPKKTLLKLIYITHNFRFLYSYNFVKQGFSSKNNLKNSTFQPPNPINLFVPIPNL